MYSPSGPHQERAEFFHDFFSTNEPATNHIIMGDFNISLTPQDQYNCQHFDSHLANTLYQSLSLWNLNEPIDDHTAHMPTWFKNYSDPFAAMKRIDYLFATPSILSQLTPAQVFLNPQVSDHSPITTALNLTAHLPKPRWRLNPLLITTPHHFQQQVQAWVNNMSQAQSLHEWISYKETAIDNIQHIQKSFQKSQNRLITTIKDNIKVAVMNNLKQPSPETHTYLSSLTDALNFFTEQKSAIYLSRLQFHKDLKGELPSSFISSLMEEQTCSFIDSIDTGQTTLHGEAASEFITTKFQEIYTSKPTNHDASHQFLQNLPQISPTQSQVLQQPITVDEITEAIAGLSPHKTPGPDGLSAFFYQQFTTQLAPTLVNVFNDFLNGEFISEEDHTKFLFALISCVPKKVKVIKAFSHIRPISLLNLDYKILSKILNTRFAEVMPTIIHPDQTGYIKGRFILTNAMALRLSLSQSPTPHVFIDFEKAFDKIQHHWIRDCLKSFGFPAIFIHWIQQMQKHNTAAFYFNCKQQGIIHIQSGNRQGDPMSGNLFVIGIEPLAIYIRSHPSIIPASLSPSQHKVIGLHVDDIWINTADTQSMATAVHSCHQFCEASGSVINISKSYTLNSTSTDLFGLTTIPDSGFCHLGLPVNKNGHEFPTTTILNKVNRSIQPLKNLHISLQGYKLLAHCYLYSLFTYAAYVLEPPNSFFKLFSQAIKKLLWNNKPKVSHKRLVQSNINYGIGLKDPKLLMQSLHTSFMMRILSEESSLAAAITHHYQMTASNLKSLPQNYTFKKSLNWIKFFFLAFPPAALNKGLFLHINNKKKTLAFHATHLRCVKVFQVQSQDISSYTNIKSPRGTKIPIPYKKSKGTLNITYDLHHLKLKYYTPTPTLKQIYNNRLQSEIPPPDLSTATIKKLQLYQIDTSIFKKIWKMKVRPYLKQFCYLFLLNSLPIYVGSP